MLLQAYNALKAQITAELPNIKYIDWFNDQYEGTIHTAPAIFVEFPVPLKLKTLRTNYQEAPFTVRIHVVTKALSDQKKTIKQSKLQEHSTLVEDIFKAIHRFSANDTEGKKLFTSLNRFDLTHHQYIKGWLMTTQDFSSQIYQHEDVPTGTIEEIEITGTPKYKFD